MERLQRMIKTSQFFPFRFPLTRIRVRFSLRIPISSIPIGRENFSPPIPSFVSCHHYHLSLPPPIVAFCFCFVLHSLSLSPPLPFSSIRTLYRCTTPHSIEKLFFLFPNLSHPGSPPVLPSLFSLTPHS